MNIQIIRKSTIIGTGFVLGMLSPILAQAGCSQIDLKGTWFSYGESFDSYYSDDFETDRCKIKINSSGSIVSSSSSCTFRYWKGKGNVDVTGGSVKVSSNCSVTGKIIACGNGFCRTSKIEYGTMARDKNSFAATGYATDNPDILGTFNAIKK